MCSKEYKAFKKPYFLNMTFNEMNFLDFFTEFLSIFRSKREGALMTNTIKEVLEFIKQNDVKFCRLAFCDPFGMQKNISIMPDELPRAFENGIAFNAAAIRGFCGVAKSDLLLFPDHTTLSVLPWRPQQGRVIRFYCDIINPDKTAFAFDGRQILRRTQKRCADMGYSANFGAKCQFYLFKNDENGVATTAALDEGGYLDMAPIDKGENIRREICLCLEEMGIKPEASHHENGPGQNEIDFKFGEALNCADNFLSFKSVVKAIAARNGLFASFMPKPIPDKGGSGLHVNISLIADGANIFDGLTAKGLARSASSASNAASSNNFAAQSFIAGILSRISEITLFLNPTANSYERLGGPEAPKFISWSPENRLQLIRIPTDASARARIELRSPDASLNPYIAYALILEAGLDGIKNGLKPPPPLDLYNADEKTLSTLARLPASLSEAVKAAQSSAFARSVLGGEFIKKFIAVKMAEAADFEEAENKADFCRERYFKII
jgi:glutamine synthetase